MLYNQQLRADGLTNERLTDKYWKRANTEKDQARIDAEQGSGFHSVPTYHHPVNDQAVGNIVHAEVHTASTLRVATPTHHPLQVHVGEGGHLVAG